MQPNVDYVIAPKSRSLGDLENQGDKKGVFIGTKNYFFFIPAVNVEQSSRKITTTTMSYEGLPITDFLLKKVEESDFSVNDLEQLIINDIKKDLSSVKIVDLENDVFKFKIVANFFSGTISTNKSDRKVGWDIYLYSLGKEKKLVREFYLSHPKLSNK